MSNYRKLAPSRLYTFRLPTDLMARFAEISNASGRSQAAMMRATLTEMVESYDAGLKTQAEETPADLPKRARKMGAGRLK